MLLEQGGRNPVLEDCNPIGFSDLTTLLPGFSPALVKVVFCLGRQKTRLACGRRGLGSDIPTVGSDRVIVTIPTIATRGHYNISMGAEVLHIINFLSTNEELLK